MAPSHHVPDYLVSNKHCLLVVWPSIGRPIIMAVLIIIIIIILIATTKAERDGYLL